MSENEISNVLKESVSVMERSYKSLILVTQLTENTLDLETLEYARHRIQSDFLRIQKSLDNSYRIITQVLDTNTPKPKLQEQPKEQPTSLEDEDQELGTSDPLMEDSIDEEVEEDAKENNQEEERSKEEVISEPDKDTNKLASLHKKYSHIGE